MVKKYLKTSTSDILATIRRVVDIKPLSTAEVNVENLNAIRFNFYHFTKHQRRYWASASVTAGEQESGDGYLETLH